MWGGFRERGRRLVGVSRFARDCSPKDIKRKVVSKSIPSENLKYACVTPENVTSPKTVLSNTVPYSVVELLPLASNTVEINQFYANFGYKNCIIVRDFLFTANSKQAGSQQNMYYRHDHCFFGYSTSLRVIYTALPRFVIFFS